MTIASFIISIFALIIGGGGLGLSLYIYIKNQNEKKDEMAHGVMKELRNNKLTLLNLFKLEYNEISWKIDNYDFINPKEIIEIPKNINLSLDYWKNNVNKINSKKIKILQLELLSMPYDKCQYLLNKQGSTVLKKDIIDTLTIIDRLLLSGNAFKILHKC